MDNSLAIVIIVCTSFIAGVLIGLFQPCQVCDKNIQLKGYVDGYFDGGYDGYNCTIQSLNDTKYEFLNCVGVRARDSITKYNQTINNNGG